MEKFLDMLTKWAHKSWMKGKITVPYNLRWILLIVCLPIFLVYVIWLGLAWLLHQIGLGLIALWHWLSGLFAKKSKQTSGKMPSLKWLWLIVVAIILLLLLLCFKGCSPEENEPVTASENIEMVYESAWDDIIIARAYLDGVQETVSPKVPRALLGFKFINGRSVLENYQDWEGTTYDEALKIISDSWKPLVLENVKTPLTKNQMTAVVLAAMRMGETGFKRSTLLKKINSNMSEVDQWFVLQDKNGNIRKTGEEPRQYFNVLKLIWQGHLTVEDLLNSPTFSYKRLNPDSLYTPQQQVEIIKRPGLTPTPKEALNL